MEEEEDDDDDEDDEVGEMPESASSIPVVSNAGRRRSAVSAESMSPAAIKEKYSKVVYDKSAEHRQSLSDILCDNFLFKGLDGEQMSTLLDAMFMATFKAGDTIIEQGAEGDNFYVVFEGACEVYVAKAGAEPAKVHEYGVGGSFGELALMYNAPRAATVKAASECTLFAVDRVTFKFILMDTTVKQRNLYNGFLSNVSILSTLTEYERMIIADALEPQEYDDGAVIIKQGDSGDAFYIIAQGEVACTQQGSRDAPPSKIGSCGVGDYFGEIALLTNRSRACTVTAVGHVKVLALQRKTFTRVMGPLQDLLKRNMQAYNSYMLM